MQQSDAKAWFKSCPWTLRIASVMLLLNLGLFSPWPNAFDRLLSELQFDRDAILEGQVWRLISGNLVHLSVEHLLLDVGVFLFIGIIYEDALGNSCPWMLLSTGLIVTTSVLIGMPSMTIYRGFSGVDSGQVAAVLCLEYQSRNRTWYEWILVIFATGIFALKLGYECVTGRLFFGSDSLGDLGEPVPLAHVAGALGAVAFFATRRFLWYRRVV